MQVTELLLEYNREITIQRFKQKLFAAASRDGSFKELVRRSQENPYMDNEYNTVVHLTKWENASRNPDIMLNLVMNFLEKSDPTVNKQNVPTLAKWYGQGGVQIEDFVSRGKAALTKFELLKQRRLLDPAHRDIGRFAGFYAFEEYMSNYVEPEEKLDKGESFEFYNDRDLRIVVPEDVEAACYYGQGTRWCTTGTHHNMFRNYSDQGYLYIILPKHPDYPGEKYQFHFETQQFMDERDQDADLFKLCERYPQLRKIFAKEAEKHHVVGFLYEDIDKEFIRQQCRAAVIELYYMPELKIAMGAAAEKVYMNALKEVQPLRDYVEPKMIKKAHEAALAIASPNNLTFNWIVELILQELTVYPDSALGYGKFSDLMFNVYQSLTHENNSFSDMTQPIFDMIEEMYGNEADQLMEFSLEMCHGMNETFTSIVYKTFSKKLEERLGKYRVKI